MTLPLTIRNLSPNTIIIKRIETFEDPNTQQSKRGGFDFGSRNTTSAAPSAPKLGEHSQSFGHQDLDVRLSPFEAYTSKSGISSSNAASRSIPKSVRITIENETAERHRIDTNPSYTQKSSKLLTPLSTNPSTSYTALFHPTTPVPQLTIHTNHTYDLSKWMASLPPTLPLSALSIPGTHNSHTYYRALPSVRCQTASIKSQLENGIRFLDIRVQPVHASDASKKDLYLVHGAFPVSLTGPKYLDPVLRICYEFLERNPSETIIVSLKREGVGSSTDAHLSQILAKHYIGPHREMWYTDTKIPYLGSVRGKLVLLRRYALDPALTTPPPPPPRTSSSEPEHSPSSETYGLDATAWPHNSTHALHGPLCVQDYCEILLPTSIAQKLTYSNEHLSRAASTTALIPGINTDTTNPVPPGSIFLNFLSGSNFWNVGCWPDRIARVVNRGVEEWIVGGHHLDDGEGEGVVVGGEGDWDGREGVVRRKMEGDGGAGIVVMDHVGEGGDWDLVRLIVGLNMGVLARCRGD